MLKIRPVWKADELKRFGELEEKYHYMGETHSGGDTLRLVIEDDGDLGRDRARPSVSTAAGDSRPPVHGMPSLSVSTTIRSMEAAEESNANGRAVSMKPPIAAASSMPPYHLVNFCAYPKIDIRRLAKTRMLPSRHTNTPLRGYTNICLSSD